MSIDPIQGGNAVPHNYYTPEEYFHEDPSEGSIYLRDGQRAVKVNESFINGLHLGIEQEIGESSGLLMYRCGQEWALQDMKRFNNRMRQEYGSGKREIWDMNPRFVWETWWWPLTVTGFGGWSLDLSFVDKGITLVEIRNSAVAKSMKLVGRPVCNLYAGLFAGAFSFYNRTELESIEVQCYAMGNDVCKFLVSDEKRVNAAQFWREEGAGAQEIMENLG
ncbi:MAG: V4R domain-containing protein [Pseudomonadota bacterium]